MTEQVSTRVGVAVAAVAAALLAAACDPPPCPPGSHDEMGRCIANGDAAIDAAGLGEPDAPGLDAAGLDAPSSVDGGADACEPGGFFVDDDRDGHGDPARPLRACRGAPTVSALSDDCDDSLASAHPGASELCNGVDDDCDGGVDESIQELVGAPVMLENDWLDAMAAVGVANSYVVAYDALTASAIRGLWLRRYDAAGVAIIEPSLAHPGSAPPLLRLEGFSPTEAALWFTSGDADPRSLRASTLDATTLVGVGPLDFGPIERAANSSITTGVNHVAVYVSGGNVVARAFDRTTLTPLWAEASLPFPTDVDRGVHGLAEGIVLLQSDGRSLEVVRLSEPTGVDPNFRELGRSGLVLEGVAARVSAMDPDGFISVVGGATDTYFVLRFSATDIGTPTLPVRRQDFVVEAPLDTTIAPAIHASRTGVDLVLGVVGASGLEWRHFDRSVGAPTAVPVGGELQVRSVSFARISTRRAAIFYVTLDPGGVSLLWMQRVGCE